jgi:alpha,alpha-trehalase
LERPEQVGLFLDFDGTLTRIRRRPADAHLSAGMRDLVARLDQTPALVAMVSGRKLADLKERVRVRGIWYAGDHGYCVDSPDGRHFNLANSAERRRVLRVGKRLSRALASQPAVVVDVKTASIAVHYRGASAGATRFSEGVVRDTLADEPEMTLLSGKRVWEIMPGHRVDKWTGVQLILRRSRRNPRTLVFVGDDATDERVFQRMRGITVFVGEKRQTAARFCVRSPLEVGEFLTRCLRLWS